MLLRNLYNVGRETFKRLAISFLLKFRSSISLISRSCFISLLYLVALPLGRPRTIPLAFRMAKASFVRWEMRSFSTSAVNPNANKRILLAMSPFSSNPSLMQKTTTSRFKHVFIMSIMSSIFLLNRESSETIRISPDFKSSIIPPRERTSFSIPPDILS